MNDMGNIYAFWDLIAQEAYLPNITELKSYTLERFLETEKNKRVWLFGCNEARREIIGLYGGVWKIAGVLDNAEAMKGKVDKK